MAVGDISKYTPDRVKRIIIALEQGATIVHACGYAGIGTRTYYDWLEKYPEFQEQVELAEARATLKWLHVIDQAAQSGVWQAAAWKLERRHPHIYGRRVVEQEIKRDYIIDISAGDNDDGAPHQIDETSTKLLDE
jgi:hypothetical protein